MSAVSPPAMYERGCAICGVKAHQSWMKAEVDFAALDGFAFASRKLPEYMHFDLALCPECDLVFANAVPDTAWFQSSYRDAQFDAENESKYAAQTYANEIKKLLPILSHRQSALDIGAGDGAFVASLLDAGFANVIGVEPSVEPVKRAAPKVKHFLKNDFFRKEDFEENTFDLITCFQTLEHLDSPLELCNAVYDLLRPGGMFVTVVHDFRAPLARFLGKKSPIYDIEHLQLFSPKSMTSLYQKVGFSDVSVQSLRNAYPLSYWLRLMPLPKIIKYRLLSTITSSSFGNRLISAKVGNLLAVGIKRS
ncbi:class I SAM-dependent methyltransferase [Undibacterium sp. RuRC25W]|uniref:class I SAM-dependent methyltransferase n=1 Tax=Undibacterium sp. RuRC25W TaxID=3413047 RepID=UPI003BF06DAD